MQRHSRLVRAVGLVAAAATVLGACSSGKGGSTKTSSSPTAVSTNQNGSNQSVAAAFNAASVGWVNKSSKTGGTLNLTAQGDCDSWDPANTYYAWCWNMQRLFTRTLVGYASIPGANNIKLEPDMATGMGQHNADFTQWTYHLKPGLKYDDGTPVTTKDIKHEMGRLFATDVINGGPTSYFVGLLQHPAGYKGVYKSGELPDSAVSTPDPNTIVFNLAAPYADWDYIMTIPASGPVPASKDKAAQYTLHPVSSGPYEIQSYQPTKQITFVRNPNYSQSSDTTRTPLVDKVVLTIDSDPDDEDRRLQAGTEDAEADGSVQSTFQAKINGDATLKKNSDDPVTGFTRYLAIMPSVKPLDNVHCRMAIEYALNKRALQAARGGTYGGDVANTMSTPLLPGYDPNANPYPNGPGNTGNLTMAKSELQQCGQPNGFTVKEAYVNQGKGTSVFNASQAALARVGIKVESAPGSQSTYYSRFIGSPQNIVSQGLGIAQAGWGPDFQSGYGFWNSIVNGKDILPTGNSNYYSLNDPVVNNLLDQVTKSAGKHDAEFKQIDAQVMKDAVIAPYVYDKSLYYHTPRVTNVRINFALGSYYDFVDMGVSS
jgi:peptide/nickel transport system substrate-binding protein